MPAIETVDLQREYPAKRGAGLRAVDGINIAVEAGEVYGFLGPNGAGKTTTVRMLVTLLQPTGGHATVAGHDVATEPAAVRRKIGVALQAAALDLLMTGREMVQLAATLHGIAPARVADRGDELLARVGLDAAADRRVGTYSGGMQRRLDLAMALIHEPEVLFLDEPTTGLDPSSRLTLWDEVRRLRDQGTTVFLTTQYLEEADQLAARLGIIAKGKIVAEGTPQALKAEVGQPHLDVTLADPDQCGPAREILARFGDGRPPTGDCHISVSLPNGAGGVAPIVRALDDAGITVAGLDIQEPTLDDVFLAKTGETLEGTDRSDATPESEAAPA